MYILDGVPFALHHFLATSFEQFGNHPKPMTTALANLHSLPQFSTAGMQIALDGQPIAEVINTLIATVKEQAAALQELQSYTYSDVHQRLGIVEARVARLEADVSVENRPKRGHGTMMEYLASVDQRTSLLEAHRKISNASTLEKVTAKLMLSRFMHRWVNHQRRFRALHMLCDRSGKHTLRLFYAKWSRLRSTVARQKRLAVNARSLQYSNTKSLMIRFFQRWKAVHREAEERREKRLQLLEKTAVAVSTVSLRAVARRAFCKWLLLVQGNEMRASRFQAVQRMEAISARALVSRYFDKWAIAEEMHVARRRVATVVHAMSLHAYDRLGQNTLRKWRFYLQRKERRRAAIRLVPHYSRLAVKATAMTYFRNWMRFAQRKVHQRERLEIDAMFVELSRRCDGLGTQVDVSLKTVSNTNSVLSQLVERVLAIDERLKGEAVSPRRY